MSSSKKIPISYILLKIDFFLYKYLQEHLKLMDPLICFPIALIGYWLYDLLTNMGPPIPDDRE